MRLVILINTLWSCAVLHLLEKGNGYGDVNQVFLYCRFQLVGEIKAKDNDVAKLATSLSYSLMLIIMTKRFGAFECFD